MDLCSQLDWEKWNKRSKLDTKIQWFFYVRKYIEAVLSIQDIWSFSPTENINDVNIVWIMLEKAIIASTVAAI